MPSRGVSSQQAVSPFDFPLAGKMCANPIQKKQAAGDRTFSLLDLAAGNQGIVRRVQVIMYCTAGTPVKDNLGQWTLKIYYDGEGSPTVSIPLSSLIAYEKGADLIAHSPFKTPFFDVIQPGGTATNGYGDNKLGFTLKFPMPFTNGIKIEITSASDSYLANFWTVVNYQDQLPSCWNRNLRFKVNRSSEAVAAYAAPSGSITDITGATVTLSGITLNSNYIGKSINFLTYSSGVSMADAPIVAVPDSTHLTLERTPQAPPLSNDLLGHAIAGQLWDNALAFANPHQFLNLAAGKRGWIAAVMGAFTTTDGSPKWHFLESSIRFYVDQETVSSYEFSGVEDFFDGTFYFTALQQGDIGGVVCRKTDGTSVNAYRQMAQAPIRFTNGARATLFNTWYNSTTYNITTAYYEEQTS